VFLGAIGYGIPLALIGGVMVGGSIGWHLASTGTLSSSEVTAFLKKVFFKLPAKLKDARTKVSGFKFPSSFTAHGDRTPFGLLFFPLVLASAMGLMFFFVYNITTIGTNSASASMRQIEQCVEGKDSDLLKDKYILKAICGTKYQKELPNGTLTGGADFDLAGSRVVFSGHVKLTSVHVVTEFTVIVEYNDEKDTKTFRNVWIEPNSKHKFRFKDSEITSGPDAEDVNTNDFVWSIREIKGVPIVE
jgi:hypothetical protein